jgi:hypothetical protein
MRAALTDVNLKQFILIPITIYVIIFVWVIAVSGKGEMVSLHGSLTKNRAVSASENCWNQTRAACTAISHIQAS